MNANRIEMEFICVHLRVLNSLPFVLFVCFMVNKSPHSKATIAFRAAKVNRESPSPNSHIVDQSGRSHARRDGNRDRSVDLGRRVDGSVAHNRHVLNSHAANRRDEC
jgi:hypothetical protein